MKHTSLGQYLLFAIACLIGLVTSAQTQVKQDQQLVATSGEEKRQVVVEEQKQVQKIFEIKHADPRVLAEILRVFTGGILPNADLRVIAVSGSRESVAAVEDAIRRLDVPPPPTKNIELIAFLLVASEQASGKNTPPELDSVVTQLKSIFKYQGFQLLDTLVVRSRDRGRGSVNGVAPGASQALKTLYDFNFQSATITSDNAGRTIRIDRLKLGARLPVMPTSESQLTYVDTGILTDIDVREGQKVVVGKATIDGSNNALFLVLTAKVLD